MLGFPAAAPTHPPQKQMKNLSVVNKKLTNGGLYVGRPSPLGNPYKLGRDGDRPTVIQKYRRWLWSKIQRRDSAVIIELERLKALVIAGEQVELMCWCAPQPCHADVIKNCINWMIQTQEPQQ